jgi:hypothetical protein
VRALESALLVRSGAAAAHVCLSADGSLLAASLTAPAQQPAPAKPASPPTMASMMQSQMGMVERQFVAAAEAMPDDKYSFAPGGAEFSGVRTLRARAISTPDGLD